MCLKSQIESNWGHEKNYQLLSESLNARIIGTYFLYKFINLLWSQITKFRVVRRSENPVWAHSNVVGMICPLGWDRINWNAKNLGRGHVHRPSLPPVPLVTKLKLGHEILSSKDITKTKKTGLKFNIKYKIVYSITRKIQFQHNFSTNCFVLAFKTICVHNMCWTCIFLVIQWTISCHIMG